MTDAQTEARAIALEPLNDLARKKDLFIDNAATASQTDFDEVTREAIELNVIAPLILALSERDTALAAKDAELAKLELERDRWEQHACTGDDVLARTRSKLERKDAELNNLRASMEELSLRLCEAERAEAQLAEARKALGALDRMSRGVDWCDQDEQARRWEAARRALEAQGGER